MATVIFCEFYSIEMAQCRTCIPLTLVAQQLHGLLGKSFSNSYIFNSSTDELTIFLFPEGVKCGPISSCSSPDPKIEHNRRHRCPYLQVVFNRYGSLQELYPMTLIAAASWAAGKKFFKLIHIQQQYRQIDNISVLPRGSNVAQLASFPSRPKG